MVNNKLPKYLSLWQNHLDIDSVKDWCGSYNVPWKKQIRKHIQDENYRSVLDCGAGVFSEYFGFKDDNYDIKYTATEITQKYVDYGISNGIDVVSGSIDNLQFEDNSFDCCICLDVLNCQLEYETSIKEMLRVAKKEVIITFFKPFEDDPEGKYQLDDSKRQFECIKSDYGTIVNRNLHDGEVVAIQHFFNRKKLKNFLSKLKVNYEFFEIIKHKPENLPQPHDGRQITLHITKNQK
tara:strand:+ start:427 stop:1137 length:711 start_codon:yes stop_codon:yes gene_type:complete